MSLWLKDFQSPKAEDQISESEAREEFLSRAHVWFHAGGGRPRYLMRREDFPTFDVAFAKWTAGGIDRIRLDPSMPADVYSGPPVFYRVKLKDPEREGDLLFAFRRQVAVIPPPIRPVEQAVDPGLFVQIEFAWEKDDSEVQF